MGVNQKRRGIVKKKRVPIILIQAEGKNKTEVGYLKSFNNSKNYRVIFIKSNYTDPVNMVKNLLENVKKMELNIKDGDRAYCVFDTDFAKNKQEQITSAYDLANKTKKLIQIIKSNPCIEFWFLLHFKNTSKQFASYSDVEKELKKFIPEYEKNKNYFVMLKDKIQVATENAKKIEKKHIEIRKKHRKYRMCSEYRGI